MLPIEKFFIVWFLHFCLDFLSYTHSLCEKKILDSYSKNHQHEMLTGLIWFLSKLYSQLKNSNLYIFTRNGKRFNSVRSTLHFVARKSPKEMMTIPRLTLKGASDISIHYIWYCHLSSSQKFSLCRKKKKNYVKRDNVQIDRYESKKGSTQPSFKLQSYLKWILHTQTEMYVHIYRFLHWPNTEPNI